MTLQRKSLKRSKDRPLRPFLIPVLVAIGLPSFVQASPYSDYAMTHFIKGCMAQPHRTNPAFAHFQSLPGFKAWGPEKRRKLGKNPLGGDTDQMQGIFLFRHANKEQVFLTSAGFGGTASCLAEFVPDLKWEDWIKQGERFIAKQAGFDGKVQSRKNGRIREYKADVGRFLLVQVGKGKQFQIILQNPKKSN